MKQRAPLFAALVVAGIGVGTLAHAGSDVPRNNFPYTISKCVGTPIAGIGGVQFDMVKADKYAKRKLFEHDNVSASPAQVSNFLIKRSRLKYLAFIEEQCRLRAAGKDFQFNTCHPEFESLDEIFAGAPGDIWTRTGKALADEFRALSQPSKAAYQRALSACNP